MRYIQAVDRGMQAALNCAGCGRVRVVDSALATTRARERHVRRPCNVASRSSTAFALMQSTMAL
jgi:hypothetical protein